MLNCSYLEDWNYLGEEVKEFLERSSTNNSMQDLTTINSENLPPSDDAISECESLPLEERIDFEPDGCSRWDFKTVEFDWFKNWISIQS